MATVSTARIIKAAVPVLLKGIKARLGRKMSRKDNVVARYLKNVRKAAEADALCDSVNDAFADQIKNGNGAPKHYGGKNPTKRIDLMGGK